MKLLNSKKGKFDLKFMEAVVTGLVVLIILFTAYSVIVPEAQSAGNSFNASEQCITAGCFYNATNSTNGFCGTDGLGETACDVSSANTPIPLSGLFSGTGVVFLIVMAVLIIVIVKGYLKSKK